MCLAESPQFEALRLIRPRQNHSLVLTSTLTTARLREEKPKHFWARGVLALPRRAEWWLTLREIRPVRTQKLHVTTTFNQ